jgi:hypothetical protein
MKARAIPIIEDETIGTYSIVQVTPFPSFGRISPFVTIDPRMRIGVIMRPIK